MGGGGRSSGALWPDHGGGPAIARFPVAHSITGADAPAAALVMMAFAGVLTRLVVLRLRARKLPAVSTLASPAPAYEQAEPRYQWPAPGAWAARHGGHGARGVWGYELGRANGNTVAPRIAGTYSTYKA
jgi:hypothetical protein